MFDYTGCDTCKSVVTISSESFGGKERKVRYCLNGECFEARLKAASEKFNQAEAEKQAKKPKAGKAPKATKGRLSYSDYNEIRSSEIDTTECKSCPNCVVDTDGELTYSSNKGARLCVNPSCYRGKISARSRVRNKAVRATVVRVEEATKEHLQGREAGLTLPELRFIHKWIGERADHKAMPKATRLLSTAKDLEDSILNCIVLDELAPIRYSHSESRIQQLQKHAPFKVKKAPKTPDKKNAKAKKKAKGKSS